MHPACPVCGATAVEWRVLEVVGRVEAEVVLSSDGLDDRGEGRMLGDIGDTLAGEIHVAVVA